MFCRWAVSVKTPPPKGLRVHLLGSLRHQDRYYSSQQLSLTRGSSSTIVTSEEEEEDDGHPRWDCLSSYTSSLLSSSPPCTTTCSTCSLRSDLFVDRIIKRCHSGGASGGGGGPFKGSRRCLLSLHLDFKDLREKILVERRKRQLEKEVEKKGGVLTDRAVPSDEEILEQFREEEAEQDGRVKFTPESLMSKKEKDGQALEQRMEARLAKREAYLEWQQGQREKGSAQGLRLKSQKAERYKRKQCHEYKYKIQSIALRDASGKNTNNPFDEGLLMQFHRIQPQMEDRMENAADCINPKLQQYHSRLQQQAPSQHNDDEQKKSGSIHHSGGTSEQQNSGSSNKTKGVRRTDAMPFASSLSMLRENIQVTLQKRR